MKYAFFILLALMVIGCRSSKHSNRQLDLGIETKKESAITRTDSTRTQAVYKDSTATTSNVLEYSRTTTYRDDGGISSLQEQWRQTGSSGVSVSSGRTSEISVSQSKDTTAITEIEKRTENEVISTQTDSRPIQGKEVIASVAIVVGAICLLIIYYLPKKKKDEANTDSD